MRHTRHYGMGNYMRLSLHVTYGEVRGLGWGGVSLHNFGLRLSCPRLPCYLRKTRLNPSAMFAIHVFHGRCVRLIVTFPGPSVSSLRAPMATAFELMQNATLVARYGNQFCKNELT